MFEVEVKVAADHESVRERLAWVDAEPLGAVHQHDVYYDHPARSFAETDEALRLRRESAPNDGTYVATLTYKGPLVDESSKTRQEFESTVDDPESVDVILRSVGFEPAAEVEKVRERFGLDGYTVALDEVVGLGQFVEIEAEGSESEVGALRDGAFDLCERLGLDPDGSVRTSYLAMLLDSGGASREATRSDT